MDVAALLAAVDAAFARYGADTRPWPNPHPQGGAPAADEYSRCLDPAKYRIVGARVNAWVEALTELGAAVERDLNAERVWVREDLQHSDVIRVQAPRPGTAPLLFGLRGFDGVSDSAVDLAAGEPAVTIHRSPECGCDACDDGSGPMLEQLDAHVLAVVSGALVHIRLGEDSAMTTGDGWSASGAFCHLPDVAALLTEARAGRSSYPTVHGLSWW